MITPRFTQGRRTRNKSGGREPAVVHGQRTCTGATGIARQTADRGVDGRCCNRVRVTTGGLRPPLLFRRRCVYAAQKSLFHRRANDVHQERRASARRAVGNRVAPRLRTYSDTVVARNARSGGRRSAVANGQRSCKGASAIAQRTARRRGQVRRTDSERHRPACTKAKPGLFVIRGYRVRLTAGGTGPANTIPPG